MRRWIMGLLALPVIVLLALPLGAQIRLRRTPSPRWTVDGETAGITLGACWEAAYLDLYDTHPADESATAEISLDEARKIADRVFMRERLRFTASFGAKPALVTITPPDGVERLAWYRVLGTDTGGATLLGKADVVYIDAQTGDPLILVTDVTVGDPVMSCGVEIAFSSDFLVTTVLPLALLAAYLIALTLFGGFFWLQRRGR